MIAVITGRPESAVAARSMRAQRSSRPSPRIARIVSLRPPEDEHRGDGDEERERRQPGLQVAALPLRAADARARGRCVKAGRNQRVAADAPASAIGAWKTSSTGRWKKRASAMARGSEGV